MVCAEAWFVNHKGNSGARINVESDHCGDEHAAGSRVHWQPGWPPLRRSGTPAVPLAQVCREIKALGLSQQFGYEFSVDVGEAEVAALEAEGELFVVEPEEMQHRGVDVVDVDAVLDGA